MCRKAIFLFDSQSIFDVIANIHTADPYCGQKRQRRNALPFLSYNTLSDFHLRCGYTPLHEIFCAGILITHHNRWGYSSAISRNPHTSRGCRTAPSSRVLFPLLPDHSNMSRYPLVFSP